MISERELKKIVRSLKKYGVPKTTMAKLLSISPEIITYIEKRSSKKITGEKVAGKKIAISGKNALLKTVYQKFGTIFSESTSKNSEQFQKVERMQTKLGEIFGDKAKKWLNTPIESLNGEKPIDVLGENNGIEKILALLTRLEWGIPD